MSADGRQRVKSPQKVDPQQVDDDVTRRLYGSEARLGAEDVRVLNGANAAHARRDIRPAPRQVGGELKDAAVGAARNGSLTSHEEVMAVADARLEAFVKKIEGFGVVFERVETPNGAGLVATLKQGTTFTEDDIKKINDENLLLFAQLDAYRHLLNGNDEAQARISEKLTHANVFIDAVAESLNRQVYEKTDSMQFASDLGMAMMVYLSPHIESGRRDHAKVYEEMAQSDTYGPLAAALSMHFFEGERSAKELVRRLLVDGRKLQLGPGFEERFDGADVRAHFVEGRQEGEQPTEELGLPGKREAVPEVGTEN
ncbi:MAG: hypothetical protein KGH72_01210 [Candidatus Micrarchaeota archaeon]|nr:hypothetical protein [Candidatus Micrarchaeota archaeon]